MCLNLSFRNGSEVVSRPLPAGAPSRGGTPPLIPLKGATGHQVLNQGSTLGWGDMFVVGELRGRHAAVGQSVAAGCSRLPPPPLSSAAAQAFGCLSTVPESALLHI